MSSWAAIFRAVDIATEADARRAVPLPQPTVRDTQSALEALVERLRVFVEANDLRAANEP